MARQYDRKLILEDGSVYYGYGFGADVSRVCEMVFNTSMVGYQEIVSDPSYTDTAVVMTYPLIGNYGITDEDFESRVPTLGALIVTEYNDTPSNFRCTKTLSEILEENDIPAMEGLDTRKLTRRIRDKGSCRVLITGIGTTVEDGLEIIRNTPVPRDLVSRVSCRKRWFSRTPDHVYNVVAVDCGIRMSTVRALNARGCNVTVVPYNISVDEILSMKPNGIIISNGPGNPEDVPEAADLVKALRGKRPLFGIGMGHQAIALAYGAKTYRLKFGHGGGNHPVRVLENGKIKICAQNHVYAVDAASVEGTGLEITHVNVLDDTVEGLRCADDNVYAVQFIPETAVETGDEDNFYDLFVQKMKGAESNA